MKFLNISKLAGLLLGIACGWFLVRYVWFPATAWLEHLPRWGFPIYLYMSGVALALFAVIPHDKHGRLILFGWPLEKYWTPGPCVLPNLFHFTAEHVNFSILYGLELFPEDPPLAQLVNFEHRVFIDQRLPVHHRNVDTSWFWSKVELVLTSIVVWFVDFRRGKQIYIFQRVGLRLMLIAYISAMLMNAFNWTQGIVPTQN